MGGTRDRIAVADRAARVPNVAAYSRIPLGTAAVSPTEGGIAADAGAAAHGPIPSPLFRDEFAQRRRRWILAGFMVLGLGLLLVRYLHPMLDATPDINTALYASLTVWIVAAGALSVGVVPARPPRCGLPTVLTLVGILALAGTVVIRVADRLPRLARLGQTVPPSAAPSRTQLTGWHWGVTALPLALVAAAAVAALGRRREAGGAWLGGVVLLWAAAQLEQLLWPTAYLPAPTGDNLLRLLAGLILIVGLGIELWQIARQRTALLAQEQATAARLRELAVLKAEFTTVIAHEIVSPIAAIQANVAILGARLHDPLTAQVVAAIRGDAELLHTLVDDLRATAATERDAFVVCPTVVALDDLVTDAVAFARTLPGDHRLSPPPPTALRVVADPARIGQVLRNLLTNAAKFAPAGTPIALEVSPVGARVRVAVVDRGPGIAPAEMAQVLAKFGRGQDATARAIPGSGVGLYLARRLLRAHGSDITLDAAPGGGAAVAFTLEIAS